MAASSAQPGTASRARTHDHGWSVDLGRPGGVAVRIHFTLVLLMVWVFAMPIRAAGAQRWWVGAAFAAAALACVALHEVSHILAARRFGALAREVVLYPVGGITGLTQHPGPSQDLAIACVGPLTSAALALVVLLCAGGHAVGSLAHLMTAPRLMWQHLFALNAALAVVNLVPAFPMDGGRVLRAATAMRLGEAVATDLAASVGQLVAIAIALVGMVAGMYLLLFVALFVYVGSGAEIAAHRSRAFAAAATAGAAMVRDFRTLTVGASLKDAADLLLETSQQDFPVMSGDEVVGVLTRRKLLAALASKPPETYVAEVMAREFVSVDPGSALRDTAERMRVTGESCVLVHDAGRLAGLVTAENLAEFYLVRGLLERPHH